jgi:hypothetical protein
MRALHNAALVVFVSLSFFSASAFAACPDLTLHETAQDCPWAQASRDTTGITDPIQLRAIFNQDIPGFMTEIDRDGANPKLLNLWGQSSNIDASNLATGILTIPANILQFFVSIWNVTYNATFTQGNAAVNHTYGYLFSNTWTPFGYKRARYTQGELESGFGVTAGLFGGLPSQGTLLSNITEFAGAIAFRDSKTSQQDFNDALATGAIMTVPEIALYPISTLNVQRLVEVVDNAQFYLELRTDIVNFPKTNTKGTDTALLIYSIDYHLTGEASKPRLITAFPVDSSFAAGIFAPAQLGDQVSIALKYNGALPVTIPAAQMVGKRFIANESTSTGN